MSDNSGPNPIIGRPELKYSNNFPGMIYEAEIVLASISNNT